MVEKIEVGDFIANFFHFITMFKTNTMKTINFVCGYGTIFQRAVIAFSPFHKSFVFPEVEEGQLIYENRLKVIVDEIIKEAENTEKEIFVISNHEQIFNWLRVAKINGTIQELLIMFYKDDVVITDVISANGTLLEWPEGLFNGEAKTLTEILNVIQSPKKQILIF